VEGTLRENGWRAESFGAGNPAASLGAAIRQRRPRMFCLSVSHIESPLDFLNVYRELHAVATEAGVAMVIGGRGLTEAIRHDMNYTAHCDALRNLVAFARALYVPPEMPAAELAVSE
jgi:methanogenic corrinoid protein MtbC1